MSFSPTYVATLAERPILKADPGRFMISKKDRDHLITAKINHRKELRSYFGEDWKKHLNVPAKSIGRSVKISF